MSVPELPAVGKIDPAFFAHVIKRRLGRADPSVLVGPGSGVGVRDAGITAMHDATECGVYGGLFEIARAANVGMRIDRARIPVQPNVVRVNDAVIEHPGTDPFWAAFAREMGRAS